MELPSVHGGSSSRSFARYWWISILLLCVASRLATTIHYVADIDSLRFALGVIDYDISALQPHFPGYPLFCFTGWVLYSAIGSYAAAFSVAGGLSVFLLVWGAQRIAGAPPGSMRGTLVAILIFFNPMVWIMSNRYMPDMMGAAVALASFALLAHPRDSRDSAAGMVLAGLLPGIRLSYLPLIAIPLALSLLRDRKPVRDLILLAASTALWLVPMVLLTGIDELIAAARMQTDGHFHGFGGTIETEPDLAKRVVRTVRGIVADGLGWYWPGRNVSTAIVAAGGLAALAALVRTRRRAGAWGAPLLIATASCALYLAWIFFFQNVIHNTRHVLPLLPFVVVVIAAGLELLLRSSMTARAAVVLFLLASAYVGVRLAVQQREPTAIAQVRNMVAARESPGLAIVSIPLVNDYLRAQNVDARFFSVEDAGVRDSIRTAAPGTLLTVGDYRSLIERPHRSVRRLFHNPYVNRVWPVLEVYEY